MRSILLTCGLVACGGDDLREDIKYDEVAQAVAATVATPERGGTLGAVDDSFALAFGGMPEGFTVERGMASGSHGSLDHRYIMVMCRDTEHRLLPACTIESNTAVLVASWSGRVALSGLELRTDRQGMWTLGNLQDWMPTVSGTSVTTTTAVFAGASTGYRITANATENMLAPQDMMGGNIQLELAIERGPYSATISGEIVFDAIDWSAMLVLDGDSYRIDLGTGELVR
jgi:hypothetical protein